MIRSPVKQSLPDPANPALSTPGSPSAAIPSANADMKRKLLAAKRAKQEVINL